jgi:hypothetical protein
MQHTEKTKALEAEVIAKLDELFITIKSANPTVNQIDVDIRHEADTGKTCAYWRASTKSVPYGHPWASGRSYNGNVMSAVTEMEAAWEKAVSEDLSAKLRIRKAQVAELETAIRIAKERKEGGAS